MDFTVVAELQLPEPIYRINHWFVTEKGLFLSPTHPDNIREEDLNCWHVFQFQ